jgi:hypothetical protein
MSGMEDQVTDPTGTDGTDGADDTEGTGKRECVLCEKVSAIVGCLIGVFLFAVGVDLLTRGALSRRVNRTDARFDAGDGAGDGAEAGDDE